jgi:hypothetical protein
MLKTYYANEFCYEKNAYKFHFHSGLWHVQSDLCKGAQLNVISFIHLFQIP